MDTRKGRRTDTQTKPNAETCAGQPASMNICIGRPSGKQIDRQTDRQTGRQAGKDTVTWTDMCRQAN